LTLDQVTRTAQKLREEQAAAIEAARADIFRKGSDQASLQTVPGARMGVTLRRDGAGPLMIENNTPGPVTIHGFGSDGRTVTLQLGAGSYGVA